MSLFTIRNEWASSHGFAPSQLVSALVLTAPQISTVEACNDIVRHSRQPVNAPALPALIIIRREVHALSGTRMQFRTTSHIRDGRAQQSPTGLAAAPDGPFAAPQNNKGAGAV